ncbi:MAG TPA: hypothetical protein VNZ58_11645 [Thermomicrobiales bacterium]|nr:hypothetical protein [Thermomicrobiales bacterium]
MSEQEDTCHEFEIPGDFSLAQTCAPAWWVGHRSPRHAWLGDGLVEVELRDERTLWRRVSQPGPGLLRVEGSAGREEGDAAWASRVLRVMDPMPAFTDPVIARLAGEYAGLRPYCDGSLFDGILTAIIGQSISLASAAAAQFKLARAFNPGIEVYGREFYPLPAATQLADASAELIRSSGVTWKRAEGIIVAAKEYLAGNLPQDELARSSPDEAIRALMTLPMVGRWTAESVLLWGIGAADAHPTNDIALLNAARGAYGSPDLDFKGLDVLAEQWRPGRSIAARLLWTKMFGYPDVASLESD